MPITLLIIFATSTIIGFLVSHKKLFLFLSLFIISVFFVIQYQQTKPTNFFQLTEMETVRQINRLHQYPPYGYRLGHILEERPESVALLKLEKNFIDTFNLLLFKNIFLNIIIPFFILGIFRSISIHPFFTFTLIIFSIVFFTFIGHENLNGPICLYPIIFAYFIYSFIPIKNR